MNSGVDIKTRKEVQKIQPYSPGKPIWEVQKEFGLQEIIKLASNENPIGPSPKALKAVTNALQSLHRYPDSLVSELKNALSNKYNVYSDQIIVTNGADELITLLAETFFEHDDEIIVPSPSFSEYEFGAKLMGAAIKTAELDQSFQYNPNSIINLISERTKAIFLCSPNNPTGSYISRSGIKFLLDNIPKNVLLIIDSAYCHFADAPDYSDGIEFIREGYPVVVIQTFSKIYGIAGIRVGFGVGQRDIISKVLKVKEPFNVNSLAQVAALAALEDDDHVSKSKALVIKEREKLYRAFSEMGLNYTESLGNFILLHIGQSAKEVYEGLLKDGIIVRYGGIWGLNNHIRVSIGTQYENERFLFALKRQLRLVK